LLEKRDTNHAIQSNHNVWQSVLLHQLPQDKLEEYLNFPYMAQLGLIHAIPEHLFNIATATITETSFLGLFPKDLFRV
jgi:hypothetical protein